jgi:MoaA/NifB/PqqE/SkfB family radical SAM enzyme
VISTYATRENLESGDLKKLIELGRGLGVEAVRIIDTTLSGCFLSSPALMLGAADRARLAELIEPGFVFLENLASSKKLTHPVCSAVSRRYLYVSPVGDVQPCCFVPLAFGNVREEPLRAILTRMWGSEIMGFGRNACLMNNPRFREKYHARIAQAPSLPLRQGKTVNSDQ